MPSARYNHRTLAAIYLSISVVISGFTQESQRIASVAGQPITTQQVRVALARSGQNVYQLDSATNALNDVIDRQLLAAKARELGYDKDPEVLERLNQWMIEKLVADKIDKPLQAASPTDAELKASYEKHPEEFTTPALVRAQIVSIQFNADKTNDAETKAADAILKLRAGSPFEQIVALYSDDPSERMNKGQSGWLSTSQSQKRYPEALISALLALNPGDLTVPIKTPKAIYVGKILEKRPALVKSFPEARPALTRIEIRDQRQKLYTDLCAQLRHEFPVTVNTGLLSNVVERTRPGGPPPTGPVSILATPK